MQAGCLLPATIAWSLRPYSPSPPGLARMTHAKCYPDITSPSAVATRRRFIGIICFSQHNSPSKNRDRLIGCGRPRLVVTNTCRNIAFSLKITAETSIAIRITPCCHCLGARGEGRGARNCCFIRRLRWWRRFFWGVLYGERQPYSGRSVKSVKHTASWSWNYIDPIRKGFFNHEPHEKT